METMEQALALTSDGEQRCAPVLPSLCTQVNAQCNVNEYFTIDKRSFKA